MADVLIVEDDDSFRKILEVRLRGWRRDLDFYPASSIEEARALLDSRSTPFTLAILDHHLPDGTGSELFDHPRLAESAVLAVSSDRSPEVPAHTVKAGAQHFLGKRQVTEPLFVPLLEALIERKELERRLFEAKIRESSLETIRTLLATLEHEINNPLGAVLGGAYLMRQTGTLDDEQREAVKLVEESGKRIKYVIKQLRDAATLTKVSKAKEQVFHVPGDSPWEEEQPKESSGKTIRLTPRAKQK